MKESYKEFKERSQKEFNKLPLHFAFSEDQYKQKLAELGLTEEEAKEQLLTIPGGGFIKASDAELVTSAFNKYWYGMKEAIKEDLTGNGFIYQMFLYELQNHEFIITQDPEETLLTLGITEEQLNENPALKNGLEAAIKTINATDPF